MIGIQKTIHVAMTYFTHLSRVFLRVVFCTFVYVCYFEAEAIEPKNLKKFDV